LLGNSAWFNNSSFTGVKFLFATRKAMDKCPPLKAYPVFFANSRKCRARGSMPNVTCTSASPSAFSIPGKPARLGLDGFGVYASSSEKTTAFFLKRSFFHLLFY
jgi:hypothetical protein